MGPGDDFRDAVVVVSNSKPHLKALKGNVLFLVRYNTVLLSLSIFLPLKNKNNCADLLI